VNRYANNPRDGSEGYATGLLTLLILFLLTAAGVAWVSMGIVASERWPIRWLEVNGAFQRVSAEQLRANLASRVGANFFTVDLQSLQAAALRISWVSAVRVQKQWPDTVRVEVEETRGAH
jgi:cell division protein FtsQ